MSIINVNASIDNTLIKKNSNDFQNNANPLDLQKNFLNLLLAQIKNQDPTNPIKNTELTSQLAQINIASGMERLNNTVNSFYNQMNQNKNIQISSLIGHHVLIPNTQMVHTEGSKTRFGVELIGYATSVEIQITDEKNHILHVTKMNNTKPGVYSFVWDGKNLDNKKVNTGKYNISVTAKNKDQNVPAESLSEALVNSIITSSSDPIIDLGAAGNITLLKIRKIFE